ncbi:MAG: hypothetical protein GY827_09545 [Cytophagales bacterium]|nr:hypothetical protein [Cytophagales bacterium]
MKKLWLLGLVGGALAFSSCQEYIIDDIITTDDGDSIDIICTEEFRPGIVLEAVADVKDAEEHKVVGKIVNLETGDVEEFSTTLGKQVSLAYEQAGEYVIYLSLKGYEDIKDEVFVDEDACHVETEFLNISLKKLQQIRKRL